MNNLKTRFTLIAGVILMASSLTATGTENPVPTVTEKDRQQYEGSGVVGGVLVGALVGGPFGAIASATLGGWVGNQALKGKENTLLSQALKNQQDELLALQAEYRALEARYQVAARDSETARLQQASFAAQPQVAACCSDSELNLHFKTNSSSLEALYDTRLEDFAALVRTLPDVVISITGHADRRGDSAANLALSQRRVDTVKNRLRTLGVKNAFLQSSAFGESMPQSSQDSLENNFFDRRVVVKVINAGNSYLTRAND